MSTDAKDFYVVIDKNKEIENTQIPTGSTPTVAVGWNKDSTKYTDGRGQEWNWNNGQLYNANGISWDDAHIVLDAEENGVLGADGKYQVSEAAPVRPTGTTGGYGGYLMGSSTPVVTPSRAAGAAPSGYADYLKGDGKGVAEGFDQAVAAAREEYARNRATFGARAESLGRAGLTGSGYGDYLEGKAFTAMQQKIGAAETAKAQSYADYLTQKEAAASSYAAYLAGEEQAAKEKLDLAINGAITSAINSGSKYVSLEALNEYAAQQGVAFDDATMASITERLAAQGITVADRATVENYNNTEATTAAANDIVNEILSSGLKTVSDEVLAHYAAQYSVPVDVNAIKGTLAGLGVTVKPQAEIDNAVPTGLGEEAVSYWANEFYNAMTFGSEDDIQNVADRMLEKEYDQNQVNRIKEYVQTKMSGTGPTLTYETYEKIYEKAEEIAVSGEAALTTYLEGLVDYGIISPDTAVDMLKMFFKENTEG